MIALLVWIVALFAAVSAAYLLKVIDSIVHSQLYLFGLRFSPEWANPYWTVSKISLALLGLIAAVASINIIYLVWNRLKGPRMAKVAQKTREEAKEEATQPRAAVPSLFQCTSCGRSISHPLRMLDFHSQRPKMINICPFCNATVVPVSYVYSREEIPPSEEEEKEEEEIKKRIKKSFGA